MESAYLALAAAQFLGVSFAAFIFLATAVFGAFVLASTTRILYEYERGVIFRLGRLQGKVRGPGLAFLIPLVDRMLKVDLRIFTIDLPPQDVITCDNVSARVNAVVYYRVVDPYQIAIGVEDYITATFQTSQTTLRSVLGQEELDDLLNNREAINDKLQTLMDEQTNPWGVKVSAVEVKDIELPQQMQRVMARQAESERERRAKIIAAEGEHQASHRLRQAAKELDSPTAVQLRMFQTLTEISNEQNSSTIVIPLPMELLKPFIDLRNDASHSPGMSDSAKDGSRFEDKGGI